METKSLRPGTRYGNKVYYAPVTVSGRHIEIGTFAGDKAHAGRNAETLKSDGAPLSMKPERIQTPAAAAITGLKLRQVQSLALRGEIPGAAKLGSLWTFDESKLRRWIRHREAEACRRIDTSGVARGTGDSRYGGLAEKEAYERALGVDPKPKGTRRR